MGIIGVSCIKGHVSMKDHLECMMQPDHPCGYSEDTLTEMTKTNVERKDVKFSPSTLQGCHRQNVLQKKGSWYLDVDYAWPMFRGNLAHALYETLGPWPGIVGTIREHRFETLINTKHGEAVMAGKPDLIVLKSVDEKGLHIKVVDYKSKGEIGHDLVAPDPKHVNQVNIYAWIAMRELRNALGGTAAGEVVQANIEGVGDLNSWLLSDRPVILDELEIVYIDMKKSRRFITGQQLTTRGKMTKRSYPREYETLELAPVPIKKPASIENWLRIRIERQLGYDLSDQLAPPIKGEDAWICSRCPVLATCIQIGEKEGYDMEAQNDYQRH